MFKILIIILLIVFIIIVGKAGYKLEQKNRVLEEKLRPLERLQGQRKSKVCTVEKYLKRKWRIR